MAETPVEEVEVVGVLVVEEEVRVADRILQMGDNKLKIQPKIAPNCSVLGVMLLDTFRLTVQ
ncbi:unnamed protein product, partial [Cuscuta campestris]